MIRGGTVSHHPSEAFPAASDDRSCRDVAVGGRLGYVLNENVLVYGKAGYANWRQVAGVTVEGLRVGGGLEVNLTDRVYTRVEYRYTDFESGVGKHGGVVGLGLRF